MTWCEENPKGFTCTVLELINSINSDIDTSEIVGHQGRTSQKIFCVFWKKEVGKRNRIV